MNEQDDTAAPLESEAQAVNEGINEGSDGDGTSDDSWIVSEGVDDRVFCSAVVDSAHVDQATLWKEDRLWRSVVSGLLDELKDEAQTIRQGSLLPRAYERGAEGETILHIAVLLGHEELVEWILERFPDLVNEIYLKDTYCGETALHVAVMKVENGNENVVKMLLKAGADVNAAPVTGAAFFNDQDKLQLYYGQTILQFAAANRQEGITQLLLDAGAHLDAVDFYGNNVLHVLAFLGNFDLNFFLKLKDRNLRDIDNKVLGAHGTVVKNLMKERNHDGLTPFQVGIARGHPKIIDCIKEIKWTFGDACEYEVTLEDIDSIQPVVPSSTKEPHINSTQHVSALEMAVVGEHKQIVDHPLFFALVNAKWLHYGRRFFLFRLLGAAFLIIVVTLAISLQPSSMVERASYTFDLRLISEIASLVGVYQFVQFNSNSLEFQRGHIFTSDKAAVPWIFSLSLLAVVAERFLVSFLPMLSLFPTLETPLLHFENILLGMSAVLGWLNLLYYSNGFRNIGPLVLIFRKVLFVDLREWLLLYAMFTAGFAAAFNLQMKDAHLNNSSILDWESYHGAVIWTVRFVFGGGNYDDFRESQFPVFTAGLFFLYGFLVLVLLVNIFIAKLSTTYEIISEDSTRLWKLQFASLMLDIDSRLSPEMQAKIASQFGWRDSAFAGKTPDPLDRRFVFTERLQPTSDGKTSEPTTLQIKIGKRVYPDGREVAILMVPDAHSWGGFFVDILYRWPLEAIVNPNVLYESWLSAEEANEHVGKKKGRVVEEPKWESSESARRKQQAVESAKAVERQKVFAAREMMVGKSTVAFVPSVVDSQIR